MNHRNLQIFAYRLMGISSCFFLSATLPACAGSKKSAQSSDDTYIPQATQKRAEKNYGQQQGMMEDLGATPAEQAAARHDAAVRDARDPQDEEE